ncbi:MAG: hypothetical protein QM501_13125, partial [Gimesia sp.]
MNLARIIFTVLLFSAQLAFAADSETQSPGSVANDSSFGTSTWSNTGNATASDDSVTNVTTGGSSQYLKVTNF